MCPACRGPRIDGPASVLPPDGDEDLAVCDACGGPMHHGVAVGMPGPAGLVLKVIDVREVVSKGSPAVALAKRAR